MEDKFSDRNKELGKTLEHSARESDRGITLVLAAHLDDCLRRLIESFLIDSSDVKQLFEGPFAPFGTLAAKTKVAYVTGLIAKEEVKRIDAVRAIRNVFAHEVEAGFDHPKVKKVCKKPPIYDGRLSDRDAFLHMAQNTLLLILYRDLQEGQSWKRTTFVPKSSKEDEERRRVSKIAPKSTAERHRLDPTVTEFARELRVPVHILTEQLRLAGVEKGPLQRLSDRDKGKLLTFLRRTTGTKKPV